MLWERGGLVGSAVKEGRLLCQMKRIVVSIEGKCCVKEGEYYVQGGGRFTKGDRSDIKNT